MIFRRLENIREEKRTNLRVGSSDFISLSPLKTFFPLCSVSDVLMVELTPVIASATSVILYVTPVILTVTSVIPPVTTVITYATPVIATATSVILHVTPVISTVTSVTASVTPFIATDNMEITSITYNLAQTSPRSSAMAVMNHKPFPMPWTCLLTVTTPTPTFWLRWYRTTQASSTVQQTPL